MTYKGMFLSALLVPITITSYGKESVDSRMQQLKEVRFQKALELSDLGVRIAEKEGLLEEMKDQAVRFFVKYIKTMGLVNDELHDFIRDNDVASDCLENRFQKVLEEGGEIKGYLLKEFFDTTDDIDEDFEAVKFYVIRHVFERDLLKMLIERYENLIQELIEIDHELDGLKKQI